MRANDEETSFVGNVRFFALLNASEKCIYSVDRFWVSIIWVVVGFL